MNKLQLKSIKAKLTGIMLAIFLVALSVLGGLNYWTARNIITENLTNDMGKVAKNAAVEVGDWLNARKTELAIVAQDPVILSGNKEAMVPYLASVIKEMKGMDGIAYASPDGLFIGNTGMRGNVAASDYFPQVMKGASYISDPRISKVKGNYVAVVAVPVKANGQVAGVLFATVDMEGLTAKVLATKIGKTGYSYVVQGDGLVIMHPDRETVLKLNTLTDPKISPILKSVTERMVNGDTGIIRYEYSGRDRIVAFAPIAGVKWSLAMAAPMEEVTESLSGLFAVSLATIGAVLVIAAILIMWFARRIAKPIEELEAAANRIAAGDISLDKLGINSNDEIGRLGQSFEQMARNLRTLIKKVLGATAQVAASSEELTASSGQSAQAANQIAASITNVATGADEQMKAANDASAVVEQMSAGIQQISANANQVAAQSAQAAEKAKDGDKAVEKAVAQMEQIEATVIASAQVVTKLGERSKEIGQIVDTISGIAGQTNLLALNAAIEAARAGEQGRGFAVVAEEVRKLAEQSQEAAKRIAELIGEIQGDTDQAVVAMDNGTREVKTGAEVVNTAGAAFREIAELVTEVSEQVKEISASLQQLAAGSQQIVGSVKKIDDLGKKSAAEAQGVSAAAEEQLASMEEIASSSQALAELAQDLQTIVNGFRV